MRSGKAKKSIAMIICGIVVALGATLAVVHIGDQVKSSDSVAATKAYLGARSMLEQAAGAALRESGKAATMYVANIASACPGIMKGTPLEGTSTRRTPDEVSNGGLGMLKLGDQRLLLLEMINGLELTLVKPRTGAIDKFSETVRSLTWSDGRITSVVRSLVRMEATQVASAVPNLCRDTKVWVASGYRTLAAGTESESDYVKFRGDLSNELAALGCEHRYPGRAILQLLKPYQRSNKEDATSASLERLETHVIAAEYAILQRAIGQAEHALGLEDHHGTSSTPHYSRQTSRTQPTGMVCR